MKRIVAVMLVIVGLTQPMCTQTKERPLRPSMADSLGKLARAKSFPELDRLWSQAPKDFAHRAVRAARYAQLGGRDADLVLLKALPTNGEEMEQLYAAQDTKQGQDVAVTDAYNEFYTRSSKATISHPESLAQFLRVIHAFNYIDNVDEWPWLCGLASNIYDKIPQRYMTAVAELAPEYREDALYCRKPPDAP